MIAMIAGVVAADVEGSVENAENAETVEDIEAIEEDIGAIVEGEEVETLTVDHRVATRAPHHRKCGSPVQKITS
jgi:hypothetical protein